jgi:dephospho-CoA kinase
VTADKPNNAITPLRIGLTGGIASGKSTVADMFAELGAVIIDTDVIAREVVRPGQPALSEIRDAFGDEFIREDGTLDRAALRQLIFSDDTYRSQLEAIVHPRIRQETVRQATEADGPYQLIVVPLLTESPLKQFVDRIVVVDCNEDTQIRRLLNRDAESEAQARSIFAAQAKREERLAIADDVIRNDDDLESTAAQVAALHDGYLALQRPKGAE